MRAAQAPPPRREKKRCKEKVARAVIGVVSVTVGAVLVPVLGPGAPLAAQVLGGFLLGASLSGGLQVGARRLHLVERFSWEDVLLTGVSTGAAVGVGGYLQKAGVSARAPLSPLGGASRSVASASELTLKQTLTHLALAHGTSNVASQLTLLSLGHQERLSGRAFLAGVAAGVMSHGLSEAFGNPQEVALWQMAVQQQVTDILGVMIRQESFHLESVALNLLGVGVSYGTQRLLDKISEHYKDVSASDTQVQESHAQEEEGSSHAPLSEDRVYEEGVLAGQGYASGHEHAGDEGRLPELHFREEADLPFESTPDGGQYGRRWLEERGMSSGSRHGVQAWDGFALEDMSFEIPLVSSLEVFSEYGKAIGVGLWQGAKQDVEALVGLLSVAGQRGRPEGAMLLMLGAAELSQSTRHLVTDGLYAVTDKLFNVSTQASRARRSAFSQSWQSMSGPERAGIGAEVLGGLAAGGLFGKAVTAGARAFSRAGQVNPRLFENQFPRHSVDMPNIIPNSRLKDINGRFNYAVTKEGNLVIGKKVDAPGGGHIDLVHGAPVRAAGEVRVVNGQIKHIDNSSGHYLPSGANARHAAEQAFRGIGFDSRGKYLEKLWMSDPKLPRGGAWRIVS